MSDCRQWCTIQGWCSQCHAQANQARKMNHYAERKSRYNRHSLVTDEGAMR